MNVELLPEYLRPAVALAGKAISARNPNVAAQQLLINTSPNGVHCTGTDFEQTVTAFSQGKVHEEGSVLVPYRLFDDYLRTLPNEVISLTYEQGEASATLSGKGFTNTLPVLPSDQYPRLPAIGTDWAPVRYDASAFVRACQRALVAVSTDDTRPAFTGVQVDAGAPTTVVCLNGIAMSVASVDGEEEVHKCALIPSKAVRILTSGNFEGQVTLHFGERHIGIEANNCTIVSTLLDPVGFPQWQLYEQPPVLGVIEVAKEDLARCVRSASVYSRENTYEGSDGNRHKKRVVKLIASPGEEGQLTSLRVIAEAEGVGVYEGEIPADIRGESVKVAFGDEFLLDAMAVIDGRVRFELGKPTEMVTISQAGDPTWSYYLSPVVTAKF